ncbi:MAG: NrfD/PsrC family molybdoenzyme membrane anchor subunit, partial [Halalkalicoccus sp.]
DTERCIGCKACMQGCPYDALYIDPETSTAAKCNYCSHRVDSGREPACVTVCPEDAIIAGDMENPETEITRTVSNQEVQTRKPEKGTEPKLFYVDGDEASINPGTTAREEHYMWSDSPMHTQFQGGDREEFDLQRAAESLAQSDVSLEGGDEEARADGGTVEASASGTAGKKQARQSKTERAYELLHEEARRVYDVGESHYISWGWEVYSYTWTKSIAAGILLLPALLMLGGVIAPDPTLFGLSALISTVFLGLTGLLLILDLDQPTRFHWVLLRPNWKSWLVKGAYIITAFGGYLGLVVLGWLLGIEAIVHPASLAVGAVLASATAVYTAFLFSQSKGRDLWQSPAMPLHMFTQAVVAGAATAAFVGLAGFDALLAPAGVALGVGLLVHLALVASEIFTPHQTEDAEEAAARITRGRFSRAFWIGAVGVGILVPLIALAVAPLVGGGGIAIAIASGAALIGLFAFEYCWITAPQTISLA